MFVLIGMWIHSSPLNLHRKPGKVEKSMLSTKSNQVYGISLVQQPGAAVSLWCKSYSLNVIMTVKHVKIGLLAN